MCGIGCLELLALSSHLQRTPAADSLQQPFQNVLLLRIHTGAAEQWHERAKAGHDHGLSRWEYLADLHGP